MKPMKNIKEFLQVEASAGIFLLIATVIALLFANSSLDTFYNSFLSTMVSLQVGQFDITKPLLLWINDGLMAIFFFMIGLELKREFVEGHLSDIREAMMPAFGAVGGIVVPALVFYWFNKDYPDNINGWAIPTATDIAFALGVLSLCAKKVPSTAKIFLLTLAIFDDLAAIIIIAMFYSVIFQVPSEIVLQDLVLNYC